MRVAGIRHCIPVTQALVVSSLPLQSRGTGDICSGLPTNVPETHLPCFLSSIGRSERNLFYAELGPSLSVFDSEGKKEVYWKFLKAFSTGLGDVVKSRGHVKKDHAYSSKSARPVPQPLE